MHFSLARGSSFRLPQRFQSNGTDHSLICPGGSKSPFLFQRWVNSLKIEFGWVTFRSFSYRS
uniref:Uncharacterized protein n=1 Tax=Arundo donax TaxID=35708 RepID=A0A0A9G3R9_ARUDO